MKKQYEAKDWSSISPEIGSLIPWTRVVRKPLRVLGFDENHTIIAKDGKIKAKSLFRPYAYLLVEQPGVGIYWKLPVTHKVDFRLIKSVFDHPDIKPHELEDRDLLVVYAPKSVHRNGLAKGIWHVLHFAITPARLIDEFYAESRDSEIANLRELFGKLHFTSNLGVYLKKNNERLEQLKQTLEAIRKGVVSEKEKRILSVKLIDQAALYSSQKKSLVELINTYYKT